MFRTPHELTDGVTIVIDDVPTPAQAGETVAAVILRQDQPWTRLTAISGARRAPYCMMGVCFDCLAEVDGIGSVQTCLTTVCDGMAVRRQSGARVPCP